MGCFWHFGCAFEGHVIGWCGWRHRGFEHQSRLGIYLPGVSDRCRPGGLGGARDEWTSSSGGDGPVDRLRDELWTTDCHQCLAQCGTSLRIDLRFTCCKARHIYPIHKLVERGFAGDGCECHPDHPGYRGFHPKPDAGLCSISLARDTNDSNNTASPSLPVYTPHEIAKNGGFNT